MISVKIILIVIAEIFYHQQKVTGNKSSFVVVLAFKVLIYAL